MIFTKIQQGIITTIVSFYRKERDCKCSYGLLRPLDKFTVEIRLELMPKELMAIHHCRQSFTHRERYIKAKRTPGWNEIT